MFYNLVPPPVIHLIVLQVRIHGTNAVLLQVLHELHLLRLRQAALSSGRIAKLHAAGLELRGDVVKAQTRPRRASESAYAGHGLVEVAAARRDKVVRRHEL